MVIYPLNQIDSQEFCTFDSRFEIMYIALYSAFYSEETLQFLKATIAYLEQNGHRFTIIHRLKKQLQAEILEKEKRYNNPKKKDKNKPKKSKSDKNEKFPLISISEALVPFLL